MAHGSPSGPVMSACRLHVICGKLKPPSYANSAKHNLCRLTTEHGLTSPCGSVLQLQRATQVGDLSELTGLEVQRGGASADLIDPS